MSVVTDVPGEWLNVAMRAWVDGGGDLRQVLSAAAPIIAKAERERCAELAETHEWFVGGIGTKAPCSGEAKAIAAAIRALGDAT